MVVSSNLHLGLGIVRGDAFPIRRSVSGIPTGDSIVSALLTLKANIGDADPGLFQIAATVEDSGSVSGIGVIRFDVSTANTLLMVQDTPYYFDIQVTLGAGSILTPEQGVTSAVYQVTTT